MAGGLSGPRLPPLGYVREPSGRELRIGYTSTTLFGTEPEPDCLRALEATIALCRELGHRGAGMAVANTFRRSSRTRAV